MSRRSSHEIVLSDVERAALERVAGALTAAFREVQRARIVLDAAAGLPDVQIAARRDCTIKTVGKWRKRFGERRLEGLSDTKRAGRPRRFPPGAGGRGQGGRV